MNNRWKLPVLFLLLIALLAAAAGCGGQAANEPAPSASSAPPTGAQATPAASPTAAPSEEAPAFPVTITDSTGTEVMLQEAPQRIVSILPSATEISFALGLGPKIVGVSDWDNYPPEVKDIAKVGGLEVNTEKVVSLRPDLVLADSSNGKSIEALRKLGLKVLVLDSTTFAEAFDTMREIGKATGASEAAEQVVKQIQSERDAIAQTVRDIPADQKQKVWVEIDPTLYTAGKNTFIDEMIRLAGGVNIAGDTEGWPQFSEEKVIQANPDLILLTYGAYIENAVDKVKARKAWQEVAAVRNNRIFAVNSDEVTRPGPRLIDGLKQIAEKLYPDQFGQ